jgi:hypothetical protein
MPGNDPPTQHCRRHYWKEDVRVQAHVTGRNIGYIDLKISISRIC